MTAGEYSAIWFRRSRFQVLESDTFWLFESSDRPEPGWDASLPRIVTWAKLHDLYTDQTFSTTTPTSTAGERWHVRTARN